MYLGIDVGGTKIAAGLVGKSGRVARFHSEATDQSESGAAVAQLIRLIQQYASDRPEAAGIGIPGIAEENGSRVWAPNIRGWDFIPLHQRLAAAADFPITVESDRNTAVLGELLYGSARGCTDAVYVILGTGIGVGIVSEGRLIRGRHGIAGAAGWIPVVFDGALAHFEDVAAGPAISRHALRRRLTGDTAELVRLARDGDPDARTLFREVGDAVGQALAVLVSLLDPQLIILGGGVSQSWDLMCESAMPGMQTWAQPEAVKKVRVELSRLGVHAGILGAAAAAQQQEENKREQ